MSFLIAPPTHSPELLARLHMHAVLPAFDDLVKYTDPAQALLQGRRFCMRLQAGKLQADLFFCNGRCRFSQAFGINPQLILRFLTHTQLNKQFTGNGFALPIPIKGASLVGNLKAFSKLAAMLQAGLLSKTGLLAYGLCEKTAREIHLRLTFSVALAAFIVLTEYEKYASRLFASSGDWTVQFSVADANMDAWVARRAGICFWGRGKAHGKVSARLIFDKPSTALKALSGELDNFVAINAGNIRVQGLAPLIDKIAIVFERVPLYLRPYE